jgi:tripeptide aminopeptidase
MPSDRIEATMPASHLSFAPSVAEAIQRLREVGERHAAGAVEFAQRLAVIPAPTFEEGERAGAYAAAFAHIPGARISIDAVPNAIIRIPGQRSDRSVVVAGHLDTVFARATPLDIVPRGNRIQGPGIGDNALGAAAVAAIPGMLADLGIVPPVDLVLTGNAGEEGLGDLRGMKAVMDATPDARAAIAVEGHNLGRVTHIAVGSKRYRVTVTGPGGHSWGDFGRANAIHVAAEIIHDLTRIPTPSSPKTSLTVGMIEGGISVNTIPPVATFLIDVRSVDPTSLERTVERVEKTLRALRTGVRVTWELIGDRPAGAIADTAPIVRMAIDALRDLGVQAVLDASSTDANVPIARGIPAVCIGITHGGNAHRVDEYIETAPVGVGLAQLLLLTLAIAGDVARDSGN